MRREPEPLERARDGTDGARWNFEIGTRRELVWAVSSTAEVKHSALQMVLAAENHAVLTDTGGNRGQCSAGKQVGKSYLRIIRWIIFLRTLHGFLRLPCNQQFALLCKVKLAPQRSTITLPVRIDPEAYLSDLFQWAFIIQASRPIRMRWRSTRAPSKVSVVGIATIAQPYLGNHLMFLSSDTNRAVRRRGSRHSIFPRIFSHPGRSCGSYGTANISGVLDRKRPRSRANGYAVLFLNTFKQICRCAATASRLSRYPVLSTTPKSEILPPQSVF